MAGFFSKLLSFGEGRQVKNYQKIADHIGTLEPNMKKLDDAELESKLGMMDKEKADLVREALARRASTKGGE